MSSRIQSAFAHVPCLTTLALLGGCSAKLPEGSTKIDLAPFGLPIAVEVPANGVGQKVGARAVIDFGPHGEAGSLSFEKSAIELKCTFMEESCKVIEQDATSLIKETTYRKRTSLRAIANVKLGSVTISCSAEAKSLANVKRLLNACKGATASGPLEATTALTSTQVPAAAPTLEEVTSSASDRQGPFAFSIRVPTGHTTIESGAGRTYGAAKGTPPASALSVTVSPFLKVASLAAAEKETKMLDIGGLDTIAEKRELSKTSFYLATAPRGTGRFLTVYVYASGKKRAGVAKCFGPQSMKATLEEMCSSFKID